jgi:hypothetical protein
MSTPPSPEIQEIIDIIQKTGKRAEAFVMMINHVGKLKHPIIVETGCARLENNYEGDGMSTLLFDRFVRHHGGEFYSVDINPENVEFARKNVGPNTCVTCSDSVKFLWEFKKPIDLLYLDSFDFDMNDPHPSSLHHILELTAIMPFLRPGTMIAVDDNFDDVGKGGYVKQFFDLLGKERLYTGYQWVWKL